MSDQVRSVLHEVMEQQTISVAKAGIICSLNARTSILASANPKESRYNPKMSVVDNLRLPPTLLSRFDLIYLLLDTPDARKDRLLARHLISLFFNDTDRQNARRIIRSVPLASDSAGASSSELVELEPLSLSLFTKYVTWSKKHIKPRISDAALNAMVSYYVEMRKSSAPSSSSRSKTVSATPRQLDSIIRLSEAHARMRLSNLVEPLDVEEAVRLIRSALKQVATNPETGFIDIDTILSGTTSLMRDRIRMLADAVRDFLHSQLDSSTSRSSIPFFGLLEAMRARSSLSINPPELRQALEILEDENVVTLRGGVGSENPLVTLVG